MSEGIPEDVMRAARIFAGGVGGVDADKATAAFAQAILGERERCAAVATQYAKQFPEYPEFDQLHNAGVDIAAAIRAPTASIPEERGTEDAPAGPSGNP
jgi:hypothetical protein